MVFNYGTFEFGPDFYMQFIRGRLLYSLSVERFDDFMYNYQLESRSVQEQLLLLNCTEERQLFQALLINALPENRNYRYDFLFDNCTTRARDMIMSHTHMPVKTQNILPYPQPTFRDLLHSYLDLGGQYWSKLGIDILLGIKVDKRVSNMQSMFLPDYLLKGIAATTVGQQPLAAPPKTILQMPSPLNKNPAFSPGVIFTILLLAVAALSFTKKPWAIKAISTFDFAFFLLLGLSGILILFMWFGTNHTVCRNNFNLLWALPTHIIAAFAVHRKLKWVQVYFTIVFIISILLLLSWPWFPQSINNALLPIVLLIILRSGYLSKPHQYAVAKGNII